MSRKYEKAKEACHVWSEKYEEAKEIIRDLEDELKNLQNEMQEYRDLKKELKTTKKLLQSNEKAYSEKITDLSTKNILLEGKIQQIEISKKELYERYLEIKQDYREQQGLKREKL